MVKTDPKITSRKAVLDSDDELKGLADKPMTTSDLSLPAPAAAEATIVTLPNSDDHASKTNVSASPPARVPASRVLGEFLELFEAKEQLYGNKTTSASKKRSTPISKSSGNVVKPTPLVPRVEMVASGSSSSSRTEEVCSF